MEGKRLKSYTIRHIIMHIVYIHFIAYRMHNEQMFYLKNV